MREPIFLLATSVVFIWVLSIFLDARDIKTFQQNDKHFIDKNYTKRNNFYYSNTNVLPVVNCLLLIFFVFTIHTLIKRLLKSLSSKPIDTFAMNKWRNKRTGMHPLKTTEWKYKQKHITKKHQVFLHVWLVVISWVCVYWMKMWKKW